MVAKYLTFTQFYDQKYRLMLMKNYSGRQRVFEDTVKYFIGGSGKYGDAVAWKEQQQKKGARKKRRHQVNTNPRHLLNPFLESMDNPNFSRKIMRAAELEEKHAADDASRLQGNGSQSNPGSHQEEQWWKQKKKPNRWRRQEPTDPDPKKRIVVAYGDAKMAWGMPGTISVSHRMIKHYMRLASERLGRFTAQDGVHESLIGCLNFKVIAVPEPFTSQASLQLYLYLYLFSRCYRILTDLYSLYNILM